MGLAGCLGEPAPDPRYRLRARPIREGLAEHLRWTPRGHFADRMRALVVRAVEDGGLVTEGFALYPSGHERPRYVERDGAYYRLTLERTATVERERWTFWFDLVEGEPPADAEIYDSSLGRGGGEDLEDAYGLGDVDADIVADAAGDIPTEFGYRDPDEEPPSRRGHVFIHRGPEDTALLPEPPFTHVRFGDGDDARYARAVAERATVELPRYRHATERVADSREAYVAQLEDAHLTADIAPAELGEPERRVMDRATDRTVGEGRRPEVRREPSGGANGSAGDTEESSDGGRRVPGGGAYEEVAPPASEGLAGVIDRVGVAPPETPEPGRVDFADEVLVRYDDVLYELQLEALG